MSRKILVTYASRTGTTAEIAETIGQMLKSTGDSVDIVPVQKAANLDGYEGIFVGCGVRYGQWLPEALKFVELNRDALNQRQTAFFTVHGLNLGVDEVSRKNRLGYLNGVHAWVNPKAEAFFAGRIDLSRLSFFERMLSKAIKSPTGDFRDWNAVRVWVEETHARLFVS